MAERNEGRHEPVVAAAGLALGPWTSPQDLWEAWASGTPAAVCAQHDRYPHVAPFVHLPVSVRDLAGRIDGLRKPLPSRQTLLALSAIGAALAMDPGAVHDVEATRLAVVLSSEFGPASIADETTTALVTGGPRASSPLKFSRSVANSALGDVARRYGARGPSLCLVGESPLHAGAGLIRRGDADVAICVGVDEIAGPIPLWAAQGLLRLEPTGRGLIPADGAGAIVLRRPSVAAAARSGRPVLTASRLERVRRGTTDPRRPGDRRNPSSDGTPPWDERAMIIDASLDAPDADADADAGRLCGRGWFGPQSGRCVQHLWDVLGNPFAAGSVIGAVMALTRLGLCSASSSGEAPVGVDGVGAPSSRRATVIGSDLGGNRSTITFEARGATPEGSGG